MMIIFTGTVMPSEFKFTNNIRSFLTDRGNCITGFTANSSIGVRDPGNDARYGKDPFIVQIKVKDGQRH